MYYIGIDLGTSAVKLLLMNESGSIENIVSKEYPLYFPRPGWSEQKPEDWWSAVCEGIRELTAGIDPELVRGIGCGGQMHGLVVLDEEDHIIRPAILWNDGRTQKETDALNQVPGKERLIALTGNIAFAGFTAPKLLWMKAEEPDNFARIARIMLPKDYINYRLSGVHCTDCSDASGTLLFDVRNRCWSKEMLEICGIREKQMPRVFESYEAVGTVLPEVGKQFGFSGSVIVCAGAGDNAAAAVGCGIAGGGKCNISLGTSGTIFITSDQYPEVTTAELHCFDHADGGYHLMGCMLSAASCNSWWMDKVLETNEYTAEQEKIPADLPGHNRVFFLPYLMGERSPHNDTNARGAFIGLDMNSGREEMTLAVLEGVAFALKDCLEIARGKGISVQESTLCGGGSKSLLWRRVLANVLGIRLLIPQSEQGPGYGGAILAAAADGKFEDLVQDVRAMIPIREVVEPEPELSALYQKKWQVWHRLYPALKQEFAYTGKEPEKE